MTIPPKDPRKWKIGDHGDLVVPAEFLHAAGLGPKMFVRFRVEGKEVVIEKAVAESNPLDAPLGRKVDKDLLGRLQEQQEAQRNKARELFDKKLAETPKDDEEPPDHPFRWD